MTSRALGLLREQVLLITFGAGPMDAYNVAFRLPNLVRDLFAEGAMSAAFVPTFTRELQRNGKDAAWQVGRIVISGLVVVTGVLALLGILLGRPADATGRAGDFASVPGKLERTTRLTQVMFPFLMLIAVAVASMGMLNALRRFFIPALAPAMFNVASILSVFAIVPLMPLIGWDPMLGAGASAPCSVASGRWPSNGRRCGARASASVSLRAARSALSRGRRADGSGHRRPGRGAGEPAREPLSLDARGRGRGQLSRPLRSA